MTETDAMMFLVDDDAPMRADREYVGIPFG